MHMSMESIVPKYQQIRSRIVGRVGFGVTHCPALTLTAATQQAAAAPQQHCCCYAAALLLLVRWRGQTNKQTSRNDNKAHSRCCYANVTQ